MPTIVRIRSIIKIMSVVYPSCDHRDLSCNSSKEKILEQRAAIESVSKGKGLREAARLYNVPVEILRRRVT